MNAEGIPAPRTAFWNLPSIKRIIKNEVYKGTVLFNNRKEIMENGKRKYKIVETIRAENAHPKIIELKEWFEANTERVARAEKFAHYREKPATKSGTSSLKDLVYGMQESNLQKLKREFFTILNEKKQRLKNICFHWNKTIIAN